MAGSGSTDTPSKRWVRSHSRYERYDFESRRAGSTGHLRLTARLSSRGYLREFHKKFEPSNDFDGRTDPTELSPPWKCVETLGYLSSHHGLWDSSIRLGQRVEVQMGVDWIPCRVELGCSADALCEHVRREALHFRAGGGSLAATFDSRIHFTDAERERNRQAYLELGPLHAKLLLKRESHRVSVISSEVLFPIEWRLDAERTIPPEELSDQLAMWQSYREAVMRGAHRPFLEQLYIHASVHELVTVDFANLLNVAQRSLTATSGWARTPEVMACRKRVLAESMPTLPSPPNWQAGDRALEPSLVVQTFAKVESEVLAWNTAVRRGNARLQLPKQPLPFEDWIAALLKDERYDSFLAWVEPWQRGGYGLYRDCE